MKEVEKLDSLVKELFDKLEKAYSVGKMIHEKIFKIVKLFGLIELFKQNLKLYKVYTTYPISEKVIGKIFLLDDVDLSNVHVCFRTVSRGSDRVLAIKIAGIRNGFSAEMYSYEASENYFTNVRELTFADVEYIVNLPIFLELLNEYIEGRIRHRLERTLQILDAVSRVAESGREALSRIDALLNILNSQEGG